jgi:hypothetical protein
MRRKEKTRSFSTSKHKGILVFLQNGNKMNKNTLGKFSISLGKKMC